MTSYGLALLNQRQRDQPEKVVLIGEPWRRQQHIEATWGEGYLCAGFVRGRKRFAALFSMPEIPEYIEHVDNFVKEEPAAGPLTQNMALRLVRHYREETRRLRGNKADWTASLLLWAICSGTLFLRYWQDEDSCGIPRSGFHSFIYRNEDWPERGDDWVRNTGQVIPDKLPDGWPKPRIMIL